MSGLAGVYDLADEDQAKEYLEKLGIEYRFQCFHEKLPDGCHRLADFLEAFKKDLTKARTVYQSNCDEGKYGHSCFKFGNYNLLGKAGEKDMETAIEYYKKGCDYKYGPSCHNMGLMLHGGKTGKKDFLEAEKYFLKGCEEKDKKSCNMLSAYYITGKEGIEKDMQKAFKYGLMACEMGHMYSCANVSQMYRKGEGVDKNPELAEKFKERAKELFKNETQSQRTITFG